MVDPIRIVLPIATPSLNETHRMHWAKRSRLSKQLSLMILASGRHEKATGRRRLVITRKGKRALDKDNAYGGCKMLIDELKRAGLIVDDDAANVELEVRQERLAKGERPHTVVEIADPVASEWPNVRTS
jgi:hypothetical protein